MLAVRFLALRHAPMVRAWMNMSLGTETNAELKLVLDARARGLCPGVKSETLADLLTAIRPSTAHTKAEVNRIAFRTLYWSGVLGSADPGPAYELALRGARSRRSKRRAIGAKIITQVNRIITSCYGSQILSRDFKTRILAYIAVATLHIYEQAGGDPVNPQLEEESWSI